MIAGFGRRALAALLMFGFMSVGVWSQEQRASADDHSKPQINVLTDCGVRGDGASDDSAAIQHCIDDHPSRTIFFPKSKSSLSCDYKLSQTISFSSYSTALQGEGGTANGNTTLCWTADVSGVSISGGLGQAIRNMNLRGSSLFNAAKPVTYRQGMADGIRVNGGQVSLRDVDVNGFSRHGVNVDSKLGGEPDIWIFQNVRAELNRGDGFHFSGQDANAGLCLLCISRLNQGWGFYDDAVIPSTFVAPLTDANHNDPTNPTMTVEIKRIVVSHQIATVTTARNHDTIPGDWGVIRGCPEFANKWPIINAPSSSTLQFRTTKPDGTYCQSGSARYGYQAGARTWASGRNINDAEMATGSYNLTSPSAHWTQNDLGTLVCIVGAGPGRDELCSTVKLITGNIAVLTDTAASDVRKGTARIVTNGGPYNTNNSTFVESYAEGNQEGYSQLLNSLTLGTDWGTVANWELENLVINNGYASPLKFTRRNIFGGYTNSIFQAGRAYGYGSVARDPSYEGFWNVQETDNQGTVLANLSFRRSNITGAVASGWTCFTQDTRSDGTALAASSLCLPDAHTRVAVNRTPSPTQLPMLPAGGFWVKGEGVQDAATSTTGLRQIRYDQLAVPKSCNTGDIFYKPAPVAGGYVGWVCTAPDTPLPFGKIANANDSFRDEKVSIPVSSEQDCHPGQWAADSAYYYLCIAKNRWRRAPLNGW